MALCLCVMSCNKIIVIICTVIIHKSLAEANKALSQRIFFFFFALEIFMANYVIHQLFCTSSIEMNRSGMSDLTFVPVVYVQENVGED